MAYEIMLQDVVKIQQLFTHQKWEIDESNESSLYNRYIHTYKRLDIDERDLFINLSYHFEIVTLVQYQEILIKVLSNVVKKYLGKKQTLYIYPIKKRTHKDQIKSSDLVTYLCNSTQLKYSDVISKKKIVLLGSMKQIENKRKQIGNNALIIIDDFIGTGKYASEVINELVRIGITKEQIITATLYITKSGLEKFNKEQYCLECGEVVESYIEKLSVTEKKILARIEKKMGVESDFSFGYGHSGTLISLIRTPNNTFPIFWEGFGGSSSPPFPR